MPSLPKLSTEIHQPRAPLATDDQYARGSRWIDTVGLDEYVLVDPTDGAAVWNRTGGAGVPATRTITAGAGLTGGGDLSADRTIDAVANPDGSIVVGPDDIGVGVLASDAQHGERGGGTLHPVATASDSGFMSSDQVSNLTDLAALWKQTDRRVDLICKVLGLRI